MTKLRSDALSDKERGYLIGMFVGDGAKVVHKDRGAYIEKFSLDRRRDKNTAEYVKGLFAKTGKRIGQRIERNSITLRVFSKEFLRFLAKYVKLIGQKKHSSKKKSVDRLQEMVKRVNVGIRQRAY